MHVIHFKEELFMELLFQGLILVDFHSGVIYNTHTQAFMGYTNNTGYCGIAWKYQGKTIHILAHRLMWMAAFGPIPPGMQINHINGVKTDNRLCNLELVTPQQNVQHAFSTGLITSERIANAQKTYYRSNRNAVAKLTERQIKELRQLREQDPKTYTFRKLGKIYSLRHTTVCDICHNKTYKELLPPINLE